MKVAKGTFFIGQNFEFYLTSTLLVDLHKSFTIFLQSLVTPDNKKVWTILMPDNCTAHGFALFPLCYETVCTRCVVCIVYCILYIPQVMGCALLEWIYNVCHSEFLTPLSSASLRKSDWLYPRLTWFIGTKISFFFRYTLFYKNKLRIYTQNRPQLPNNLRKKLKTPSLDRNSTESW